MEIRISSVRQEDNSQWGVCTLCNRGNKLRHCDGKGCNRKYHLSCINPSLDNIVVGLWHCPSCVRKKILLGIHFVSEGIESIWDVRGFNASDDRENRSRMEKQYFVKYKGLAHVHNRWIAESLLFFEHEAPALIAEFNQRKKVLVWKRDWIIPECLLQKRPLISSLPSANNMLTCKHEWLVKWHGLDYEQATWEMENASFICSLLGQSLIQDFESRENKLKQGPCFTKSVMDAKSEELLELIEYWIPVDISYIQLEQYCATLFSNSNFLCSSSRLENLLDSLLIAIRKCCNHPYVLDPPLQMSITKDLKGTKPFDVGIKVSGKLQVLDAMLAEMKKQHLKVIILFQIVDSGKDWMGDILDDFLWQRFGPDSYARIDSAVIHPEKVSAVTKFNREQKRFVLLLEKRASSHLIKISSLDAIILFDSNFNLMKDLRTLKKMIVDPQAKPIKLFRLYTSCTLEESVLILATQGKIPEDGIYCSLGRLLLMWGAPNLFDMLKRFHENADSTVEVSNQSHMTDVLHEFCQVLAQNGEDIGPVNLSLISQVKPGDKIYYPQTSSFGKQSIQDTYDDSPQIFWRELFDGKNPKWKYASVTIPGKRKRFQDSMGCAKDPKSGNFEVAKKQRTVADANVPKDLLKNGSEGGTSPREKGGVDVSENEGRKLQECQRALHISLKPKITELSDVLKLPKDVKAMVDSFLEYVLNHHNVNRNSFTLAIGDTKDHVNGESDAWLQAFQIALCWTAVKLLGHFVGHAKSIALAKQHLNYSCTNEEADFAYSLLRCLEGRFLHYVEKSMVPGSTVVTDISYEFYNSPKFRFCVENYFRSEEFFRGNSESASRQEFQTDQRDLWKTIKWIHKQCEKQMSRLRQKQMAEKDDLTRECTEKTEQLENKRRIEEAVIRLHRNSRVNDRLKKLDNEYVMKFEDLRFQRDKSLKDLDIVHTKARNKLRERKARWVEAVKLWALVELLKPPLSQAHLSGEFSNIEPVSSMIVGDDIDRVPSDDIVSCIVHNTENAEASSFASRGALVTEGGDRQLCSEHPGPSPALDPHSSGEQDASRAGIDVLNPDVMGQGSMTIGADNDPETLTLPASEEQILDVTISRAPNAQVPVVEVESSPEVMEIHDVPYGPIEPSMSKVTESDTDTSVSPHQTGESFNQEFASQEFLPRMQNEILAVEKAPLPSYPVEAQDVSHGDGDSAETSVSDAVIDLTSNSPDLCESAVEFEEQMQHLGGGAANSVVCALPSSSGRQNLDGSSPSRSQLAQKEVDQPSSHNLHQNGTDTSVVTPSQIGEIVNQDSASQQSLPQMQDEILTVEEAPLSSYLVEARDVSHDDGDSSFCDAEASVLHAVIDLTSNSPDLCEPTVELEEQMQHHGGGSAPSVLSDLPSSSGNLQSSGRQNLDQNSLVRGLLSQNEVEQPSSHNVQQRNDSIPGQLLPQLPDPLEIELERIRKQTEEIITTHDKTKQRLKSDCEKEIEKVVSEIRERYNTKLKEEEADFLTRKEELDSNLDRVLMNKNLAEAFKSKCMSNGKTEAGDIKQGVSSMYERLVQLASQHSTRGTSNINTVSTQEPAWSQLRHTRRRSTRLASTANRAAPTSYALRRR